MIIQAIPASGKTFLSKTNPGRYIDSDYLFQSLGHRKASKAAYENLLRDESAMDNFRMAVNHYSAIGCIVMCNFDPSTIGCKTDVRFTYAPNEYVSHVQECGRFDLLDKFSLLQLESWANDYTRRPGPVIVMTAGTFLADQPLLIGRSSVQEVSDVHALASNR